MGYIAVDLEDDTDDERLTPEALILTPEEMRAIESDYQTALNNWRAVNDTVPFDIFKALTCYQQLTQAYNKLGTIDSDEIRIPEPNISGCK